MNQLPAVPALGLTLSIPRDRVQRMLETQIAKGSELIREKAASPEVMAQLKKRSWDWTLETVNFLKEAFSSDAVSLYFSSNVFFEPSLKLDDFQRDLDEFPFIIRGKLERLYGFNKTLMVIPEPPCGDFVAAQFHPRIYYAAWRPFELHQFGQAINACVKELEDAIKEVTAGNIQESGAELVKKAFDPEDGLLFDKEGTVAENQGVTELLSGFMTRYHGMPPNSVLDLHSTARVLSLASYLMYTLDLRMPKKPEKQAMPVDFEFLKD
jgi:hypothetical protein